jgi:hypothetical protein
VITEVEERTPPQVHTAIAYDGELAKPSKVAEAFYKKVKDIRRDPTIKLVRQFAVAPLVASKWSIEKRDDAPEGASEFIEKQIEKHRLNLVTQAMYGMIDYGWQTFERVVEDTPDGLWGVKWLKPLLHEITTILVDPDDGSYIGIRQEPLSIVSTLAKLEAQIDLSAEDVLLFSADVEGTNWYGEPVMKALEPIYDEQATITKGARKYDARIAGAHWIIYYPLGISKYKGTDIDNGALAEQILKNIEAMGGIALPRSVVQAIDSMNEALGASDAAQWKIELLSDKGASQAPFLDRYKYLDILKVRAFGYPERAMLEGQFGTKAEAEAHADLAILNLEMKNAQLIEQVNKQYCDWLLRVNWGPEACGSVFISPAPLADRAIGFFREVYKLLIQNRDGFFQEAQAVDWKAFRDKLDISEMVLPPIEQDMQQLDEWGNVIGVPPIEYTEPIAAARDMDGKFGDGGKSLESPKDLEHLQAMNKLKVELEGSKQNIAIGGRTRKMVVKEVRTSREAGRRKVAYQHVGEAFDLDGNHVASVVRYPSGLWREG